MSTSAAQRGPARNAERASGREPRDTPERVDETAPERATQRAPGRDTRDTPERTPERVAQHAPERAAQPEPEPRPAPESGKRNGWAGSAGWAARRAASEVADLTGQQPETVISIERLDDGWQVGVEVVETHRIPDSADILAAYEVRLEPDGELVSYRRTQRYSRGQMNREYR